ncbi:MAG TPA: class I SAM-dependent methyltransferase [Blastocatellia bacterium]|jgi:SAM-dependent methyltransferase|nr:class I SAM-dependent methyltransferase [Blastocatellia bacterium]
MSELSEHEENIGRYYDEVIFDAEVTRLKDFFPVEYAITARHLRRWIRDATTVIEIGVGGGLYSEMLALQGHQLCLVDVSAKLLDAAVERLRGCGLEKRIVRVERASATNLDCFQDNAFGAVLMLGPLYHLLTPDERVRAVGEAERVLKPSGILFASGINRLAYLRDLFRESPEKILARRDFIGQFLRDGNLTPEIAPPIGHAHLTTVDEFRDLFAGAFKELALVGVEAFSSPWQVKLNELSAAQAEAWLDLIERAETLMPDALGMADHFLYVGEKSHGSLANHGINKEN